MRTRWLQPLLLSSIVALAPSTAPAAQTAAQPPTQVAYRSADGTEIRADLHLPPGPGPFPAVVLVHGSGDSDRSNPWTSAYAAALVERNVAVLHPDKRGSGESGGRWQEATFVDLAHDAVAGVELLLDRSEIKATAVGVIGFSQGGHVVAAAAHESSDIAFVVDVSGSVVPILEQIGDELRLAGEREGLSAVQLADLAAIHARAEAFVLGEGSWSAYSDALAEAKSGSLAGTEIVAGFPVEESAAAWSFLRTIGDFDPMDYWVDLQVPTVFVYGGRDENVDVYKSVNRIVTSLTQTGLPYSLLLFRNNGHALFRQDAMDFLVRWIHDGGVD